jgi:hypothetical protein
MSDVLWSRRLAGGKSVSVGGHGERTIRAVYNVRLNVTRPTLEDIVLGAAAVGPDPIPAYGDASTDEPTATCSRIDPQETADPLLYRVVCEWTTIHGGVDPADLQMPPDQQRTRWSWRYVRLHRSRSRDLNGRCFKDSAGTPFNPPPAIPVYAREYTIRGYTWLPDMSGWEDEYLDATNSDNWLGYQPHECLVEDISTEDEFLQGQWWFRKVYRILALPYTAAAGGRDEWGAAIPEGGFSPTYILDAGPKKLDDSNPPKAIPIADTVDGRKYVDGTTRLLNGAGGLLASGAQEIYLAFVTHKEMPFAPLNLVAQF